MAIATEGTAESRKEGLEQEIQRLVVNFCSKYGILESTRETWIQWDFDVMTEMFDRIGLHTNVGNTVSMECQPCFTIGGHSTESYGLRMTGEGLTYWEILR